MKFTKMHGCGNDYIYFDCFKEVVEAPEALSIELSDRHFGIGGDGIILISPSTLADAQMRIFNADGSEAKMCGNGIRCVGAYLFANKFQDRETLQIETLSGIKTLRQIEKDSTKQMIEVDMGAPIREGLKIPTSLDQPEIINEPVKIEDTVYELNCVSMGNPHCVVFTTGIDALDLETIGPKFEKHPMFPEQVNTEFIEVISPTHLKMRVWERGSGETFACGTGACASVVAAVHAGHCKKDESITVSLRGGDLKIRYTDETVYMIGEAVKVFEGEINE